MKICLVSQEYPPETAVGGIGTQTWNKARALVGLGHTVHVLSCSADPDPGADVRTETDETGAVVHRMPPPEAVPIYGEPAYWLAYSLAVHRELARLSEERFDVVDFAEYGAEGAAYQLDRTPWNWIPVVVQLHGPIAMFSEFVGWPERGSDFERVGSFLEGVSIERADALMACSGNIADFTSRRYGVDRASIDVVHCGVDVEAFHPRDRLSGSEPLTPGPAPRLGSRGPDHSAIRLSGSEPLSFDRRPTVLFVGNLALSKGLGTVLDAVLSLVPRRPDLRLRVLGRGDEGLRRELLDRADAAGAAGNVEFVGHVGDRALLPGYYREADVFCSPAVHEVGVANVYIEAMACGSPVVAAASGAAAEAVEHERTGLLVPPGDVAATAAALDRLLDDAALRARLGAAARERAEDYFGMDRYIERVLATYERAIAASAPRLRHERELHGVAP